MKAEIGEQWSGLDLGSGPDLALIGGKPFVYHRCALTNMRRARPSKGWRRHVRRMKAGRRGK